MGAAATAANSGQSIYIGLWSMHSYELLARKDRGLASKAMYGSGFHATLIQSRMTFPVWPEIIASKPS